MRDLIKKEISRGWKPGAISKRLLSKLNRAKRRESQALEDKPTKKAKKRVSDKPTLIIGKCNGEYKVEMKVETKEDINTNFSPLIYKITSADHEDRVKARARKEKRVIKEALKKIWSDLYHDNVCEATCLKAYKHAVGKGPSYDHNNPDCTGPGEERAIETDSCSCEDADVSSNCSSMDVDWEMHFSPPVACKRGERL